MDIILDLADNHGLDAFYSQLPTSLHPYLFPRDHIIRQCLSLWLISLVGVNLLYFTFSTLSYYTLYDHSLMRSPKFLPNQIRREIYLSVTSFPVTALVTVPWFIGEVRGYSKLYYNVDEYGWGYFFASIALFLVFTDFWIYWIHRFEHHPMMYWWLHKQHHAWKVTTPFASFAFHPLDGYFQSIPYHAFVYIFPMHAYAYLAAFVLVQMWTISIHDGAYFTKHPVINSSAHHWIHHLEFNYNYGQYTTLWDRIGGSYKRPTEEFEHNMFFDKLAKKKQAYLAEDKQDGVANGKVNGHANGKVNGHGNGKVNGLANGKKDL